MNRKGQNLSKWAKKISVFIVSSGGRYRWKLIGHLGESYGVGRTFSTQDMARKAGNAALLQLSEKMRIEEEGKKQ